MSDLVRELEDCAYRAWPAAELTPLAGWQLRFSEGVTRRGNSAFAASADETIGIVERIERARHFYHERGRPAFVQITPASEPAGIDAALAERGWEVESPVSIQVASAGAAAMPPPGGDLECEVLASPEGDWLALADARSRFADSPEVLRGFLARIGARGGYALARRRGEPIAMGLGIGDGAWAGIFLMLTVPEQRGRGAGGAVLGAIADWARSGGAERLYLQVERDNPGAHSLYRRAGFEEAYGYHYRMLARK